MKRLFSKTTFSLEDDPDATSKAATFSHTVVLAHYIYDGGLQVNPFGATGCSPSDAVIQKIQIRRAKRSYIWEEHDRENYRPATPR